MKKIIILLSVVLWCTSYLVGCKSIERNIEYYKACQGDADCIQKAKETARLVTEATRSSTSSLGLPISSAIGSGLGFLTSLGVMIWLGRKKVKVVKI
ncbi:MAG: hypothetical protein [Arizlama microvirus]|nr:MAG: hypothetical protein [Arizlama microvirus]